MKLEDIPVDKIEVSPFNVRKRLDDAGIESLAQSIAESGLLQPIIVSKGDVDQYKLIAGQRRYIACSKNLNWENIPAIIIENAEDKEILTMSTVENLQRADLNLIFKSDAFLKLHEMYNNDIKKVIKTTGYTEQTIRKYFLLKELHEKVKQEIIEENRKVGLDALVALIKNENILDKQDDLEEYLRSHLSTDFEKIKEAWEDYKEGNITKKGLIKEAIKVLGKKFIKIVLKS